jgi:LysR family glycine cleavage system transcriptional activator
MEHRKRRLPPLKSLLFLETVVRTGSVTAAADELSITHSAVSKQLSQLETWFGAPLFAEKRKGMVPTPGVARIAAVLTGAFDEIQDVVKDVQPRLRATENLRVIAPATFAMRWLMPRLPEFHVSDFAIDTTVRPTHTPENWLDMPFDVAIRRGGAIPDQFPSSYLFTETLSLVASESLARTLDLKGQGAIELLEAVTRPGELKAWLKAANMPLGLSQQALRLPHFYIALDAMFAGRGALVVPSYLIKDNLARGEIVELRPDIRIAGPEYRILANPAASDQGACASFIDWVKALVPDRSGQPAATKSKPTRDEDRGWA